MTVLQVNLNKVGATKKIFIKRKRHLKAEKAIKLTSYNNCIHLRK